MAVACATGVLALIAPPATAAPTPGADCVTSGQSNVVAFPTGVLSAWIDMQGAPGGSAGSVSGGAGGQITGLLTVPAGRRITVTAGGAGQSGGVGGAGGGGNGAGGGAGGGGMSTVVDTPSGSGSTDLLFAPGGGGAGSIAGATGGNAPSGDGQPSGSGGGTGAGQAGSTGQNATAGGGGGAGLKGGNAGTSNAGGGAGSSFIVGSGFTVQTNAAGTDPGGYVCVSTIAITTTGLGTLSVTEPTTTTLAATYPFNTPTLTWSIASGSLPAGLSLTGATISGTPTTAGSYTVTIKATDSTRGTATEKVLSGTVNADPPTVTVDTAADVTTISATGRATVAANGASTSGIECRIATSAGAVAAATPTSASPSSVAATATTAVTCSFSGLSASTTYWYSVSATNSHGTTTSAVESFTTAAPSTGGGAQAEPVATPSPTPTATVAPTPPVATTLPATGIRRAQAVGNGQVLPSSTESTIATCILRPTGATATTTVPAYPPVIAPAAGSTTVTCPFAALPAATSYEFAVIATSASGRSQGEWVSFTTTGRRGPRVEPPEHLRRHGWTTLIAGPTYSEFGAPVGVTVTDRRRQLPKGVLVDRTREGAVRIQAHGDRPRLTIRWSADAPPGGRSWAVEKTYPASPRLR